VGARVTVGIVTVGAGEIAVAVRAVAHAIGVPRVGLISSPPLLRLKLHPARASTTSQAPIPTRHARFMMVCTFLADTFDLTARNCNVGFRRAHLRDAQDWPRWSRVSQFRVANFAFRL
jgi:hypothetical protein